MENNSKDNDSCVKNTNSIEYTWTNEYSLPWEMLTENEEGKLMHNSNNMIYYNEHNTLNSYTDIYKKSNITNIIDPNNNLVRCLLIILDGSEPMFNMELRPSRFFCSVKVIMNFISKFFLKNPISQLSLAIMHSTGTKLLCPFQNSTTKLFEALNDLLESKLTFPSISGTTISLQNALSFAIDRFQHISDDTTKELLFLCASLTTIDSNDIFSSIEHLVEHDITVSAIHLAAEFHLLKHIVYKTNGLFRVILDESHFIECMDEHLQSQAKNDTKYHTNEQEPSTYGRLIKLGFPNTNMNNSKLFNLNVLCYCHQKESFDENIPGFSSKIGYFCPLCYTKYCSIPRKCDRCLLLLVEAPYLTRSYLLCRSMGDNIFNFVTLDDKTLFLMNNDVQLLCHYCHVEKTLTPSTTSNIFYQCNTCKQYMCQICKEYITNSLGFCPSCVI